MFIWIRLRFPITMSQYGSQKIILCLSKTYREIVPIIRLTLKMVNYEVFVDFSLVPIKFLIFLGTYFRLFVVPTKFETKVCTYIFM